LKERQKKDISDRKTKKKTSTLLYDLQRTKVYWKLKEKALVRTLWRALEEAMDLSKDRLGFDE